jgi:hypothetical protein
MVFHTPIYMTEIKNCNDLFSRQVEYGWHKVPTKITPFKFHGPSNTALMKAPGTEKTLISFRSTGICPLHSGTVSQKDLSAHKKGFCVCS